MTEQRKMFDKLCAAMPDGVHWGDALTPDIAEAIYRAAHPAPQRVAVPEVWQIVPKEPTHGMCQQCDSPRTAQAYYRAMLSAAPQPDGVGDVDVLISDARESALEVFNGSCSATKDAIEYFAAELRALLAKGV